MLNAAAFLIAAAANRPAWLGIALGEPLAAVYARMGDPIVAGSDERVTKFVYLADHGDAFLTVLSERGTVFGLRLWAPEGVKPSLADLKGIALGDPSSTLEKTYGPPTRTAADADGPYEAYQNGDLLWLYHLNGDQTVRNITVAVTDATIPDVPASPAPVVHRGTSFADALLVIQPGEKDGVRWEHAYLAVHPCANSGKWQPGTQSLLDSRGRHYDRVSATCATDGTQRDFYFDITPFFGKM